MKLCFPDTAGRNWVYRKKPAANIIEGLDINGFLPLCMAASLICHTAILDKQISLKTVRYN